MPEAQVSSARLLPSAHGAVGAGAGSGVGAGAGAGAGRGMGAGGAGGGAMRGGCTAGPRGRATTGSAASGVGPGAASSGAGVGAGAWLGVAGAGAWLGVAGLSGNRVPGSAVRGSAVRGSARRTAGARGAAGTGTGAGWFMPVGAGVGAWLGVAGAGAWLGVAGFSGNRVPGSAVRPVVRAGATGTAPAEGRCMPAGLEMGPPWSDGGSSADAAGRCAAPTQRRAPVARIRTPMRALTMPTPYEGAAVGRNGNRRRLDDAAGAVDPGLSGAGR